MRDILHLMLHRLETPVGELLVVSDDEGNLRAIDWSDHEARMRRLLALYYRADGFSIEPAWSRNNLSDALGSYFAGELSAIEALPVKTAGTPFQRSVWQALREIPSGTTASYAKLAERIGRPTAVRAVGSANGSNPIGVVVPCHRVVGTDGSLTGYAGGIERKRWLLQHESVWASKRESGSWPKEQLTIGSAAARS